MKKQSPYARIDWKKAQSLFTQDKELTKQKFSIQAGKILRFLAKAGTDGVVFLFEAHKRGAEILHPGLDTDWRLRQVLRQLEKQQFVRIEEQDHGNVKITLMKGGRFRALTYQLDTMKLLKPKEWDRKWRVVIFDIPNKYKGIRDIFRGRLIQLGLYRLQESVYISPYPCFDEIEFLRELYGVPFTVRYLLAEHIEDAGALKRHFNLS